jgi:hypothetical protein
MKFSCLDVVKAAGLEGRRRGKEQAFHCPHRGEDRHPSLMVNADKDTWMCGPCVKHGTDWQLAAFLASRDPGDKDGVKTWLRDHGLISGNGKAALFHLSRRREGGHRRAAPRWFGDLGVPVLALGGYSSKSYDRDVIKDVGAAGRRSVLLYGGL